jgi:hypothetical protein
MSDVQPVRRTDLDLQLVDVDPTQLPKVLRDFYLKVMRKGIDYSTLPGTPKPSLRKEGAELLSKGFGYHAIPTIITKEERFDPEAPFFSYVVKCSIYKGEQVIGEAFGAANSKELQFGYKWVAEEKVQKDTKTYGERVNDRGKKELRVALEPWEVFSKQNQILKMADKRAFVAAILRVTGASRIFTQDLEEEAESQATTSQATETLTKDELWYALHGYQDILEIKETPTHFFIEAKAPLILTQIQEITRILQDFGGEIDTSVSGHKTWKVPRI